MSPLSRRCRSESSLARTVVAVRGPLARDLDEALLPTLAPPALALCMLPARDLARPAGCRGVLLPSATRPTLLDRGSRREVALCLSAVWSCTSDSLFSCAFVLRRWRGTWRCCSCCEPDRGCREYPGLAGRAARRLPLEEGRLWLRGRRIAWLA